MEKHKRVVLVTCLSAYFLSIVMLYQMSPFFMRYATQEVHADPAAVGLIFAALPFASFLGAVPATRFVSKVGPRRALSLGLFFLAVGTGAFGMCKSVVAWVLWRFVQGFATAPVYCVISSTLASTFTGEGEFARVNGYQEIMANIGFSIGPMLGGAMYEWGGFEAPFVISAIAHTLFVVVFEFVPDKMYDPPESLLDNEAKETREDLAQHDPETNQMGVWEVMFRRVVLVTGITSLSPGIWGSLEPVMADHFRATLGNISDSTVGAIMAAPALSATLAAIVVPRLSHRVSDLAFMLGGFLMMAIGLSGFCLPDPGDDPEVASGGLPTGSPAQWALQLISLNVCGFGFAVAWTPCMPSLVESAAGQVVENTGMDRHSAVQRVSTPIAAVFSGGSALGEALGPIIGGSAVGAVGFDGMSRIYMVVLFAYCGLLAREMVADRKKMGIVVPDAKISPAMHFHSTTMSGIKERAMSFGT